MRITIDLSDEEAEILKKRADKNFLTFKEQVEDIVRRSAVNSKKGRRTIRIDDKLVGVFSREKTGPKKGSKRKKKK
tara:strand:+ start:253 stop:480 length:228 start_codon:yes stop_codon:yes gene_type:complete